MTTQSSGDEQLFLAAGRQPFEVHAWCAYDGEGRIEFGRLSRIPTDATQGFAHELLALHRFDPTNARLIAEDLYFRLHSRPT